MLLPLSIAGAVLWLIAAVFLLLVVWISWCPRQRYALVVYFSSPIWQEYFQTHILHGRQEDVEKMRRELFQLLDRLAPPKRGRLMPPDTDVRRCATASR